MSEEHDDRRWERPPPRYRPGRGGFDPEAAAIAARARYAFRQRVVLAMLIAAVVTGVIAGVAVPELWWAHAAVDLALVGYLVYPTALMGVVLWTLKMSPVYPRGESRVVWSAQLALMVGVGATIYFLATHIMGLETFRQLVPRRKAAR